MSGRDILDMLKWVHCFGVWPSWRFLQKTVLRHIQCYSKHHITVSLHTLHTCPWAKQKVRITWWQFVKASVLWCMVFIEVTLPAFLFWLAVTKGSILSVSGDFPACSSIMREICVRKRGSATCWIFELATSCKSWQFKWLWNSSVKSIHIGAKQHSQSVLQLCSLGRLLWFMYLTGIWWLKTEVWDGMIWWFGCHNALDTWQVLVKACFTLGLTSASVMKHKMKIPFKYIRKEKNTLGLVITEQCHVSQLNFSFL